MSASTKHAHTAFASVPETLETLREIHRNQTLSLMHPVMHEGELDPKGGNPQ